MSRPGSNAGASRIRATTRGRPYGRFPMPRHGIVGGRACPVPDQYAGVSRIRATTRVAHTGVSDAAARDRRGTGLSPSPDQMPARCESGRPQGFAPTGVPMPRHGIVGDGLVPSPDRTPACRESGRPQGSPLRAFPMPRHGIVGDGLVPSRINTPARCESGRPQGSPLRAFSGAAARNRRGRACPVPGSIRRRVANPDDHKGRPLRAFPMPRHGIVGDGLVPSRINTPARCEIRATTRGRPYGCFRCRGTES